MNRPRILELRATMKGLQEQRAEKEQELKGILSNVKKENRAFTEEEQSSFDALEKEIKNIDVTIAAEARARALEIINDHGDDGDKDKAKLEERAFVNHLRNRIENRADVNLTKGDNGDIIPVTIIKKVIQKVLDICPIYELSTRYNIKGKIVIPYYDEETQSIQMAYAEEFTELESSASKFSSIELSGFLAGALTKISKSLLNNNDLDLLNFVINAMARAVKQFMEHELLIGTTGKIEGLSGVKLIVTAASQLAFTTDELIDVQEEVPDDYQADAIWIMNKQTRTAIRKLKNTDGDYLLNKDVSARWGYTLLGKDVYTSASMNLAEAGKIPIYYGDMKGLAVKVAEEAEIQVLREKYATQHAVGLNTWLEIDSKIENAEMISALKMAE